jgi:hypothetical protein
MTDQTIREPDPEGRVLRDRGHYVRIESAVRPDAVRPGEAAEVRLTLRPHPDTQAHWNNEMDPVEIWLLPGEGWSLDRQGLKSESPADAWTAESREFAFQATPNRKALTTSSGLPGYALYYVGENPEGSVLFRRQDFTVHIDLLPPLPEETEGEVMVETAPSPEPAPPPAPGPAAEAVEPPPPAEPPATSEASQEPQAEESEVTETKGGGV